MKLNIKRLADIRFIHSRIYNALKTNGTSEIFYVLDVNKLNIFAT